MPDILDVVQKLTYESDVTAIDAATKALGGNVQAANNAQSRINKLNEALNKTASDDIKRRTRITALITRQTAALESLGKATATTIGANTKLQQSIQKTGGAFNSLQFSIGNLVRDSPSFANGLAAGFLAIGNNIGPAFDTILFRIKQLKAEGKSTKAVFSEIGGALFGLTGFINLGVLALTLFGDKIFKLGQDTDETTESLSDFNKELANIDKQARKSAAQEITELRLLEETATNTANSQELRIQAARKLLEIQPQLNKLTNEEAILNGQAANAINSVAAALINKYNAEASGRKISALADRDLALRDKENEAIIELNKNQREFNELNDAANRTGNDRARSSAVRAATELQDSENRVKRIQKERAELKQQQQDLFLYQQQQQSAAAKGLGVGEIIDLKKADAQKGVIKKIKQDAEEANDAVRLLERSVEDILDLIYESESRRPTFELVPQSTIDSLYQKGSGSESLEDAAKRQKDNIDAIKSSYQSLVGVLQTLNSLYAQQQQLLDKQYQTQSDRVRDATVLAERGNAAELKAEQDKLDGIAKKREEVARQQVQINSVLQASNAALALTDALLVVTNAGKTGDPYTIAARIAAAVAALAAGFSLVAGLKGVADSFADGVVDYKGKGTGKSDSNVVRISNGESVITAAATQKYKPMLEAMNAGTLPMLNTTTVNTISTKKLEKKMDSMIGAIEDNRFKQNIFFDERGVGIMTERAMRKHMGRFR